MSTLRMICLCVVASLLVGKEAADISTFSPLPKLISTVKSHRLNNAPDQSNIPSHTEEAKPLKGQRSSSLAENSIQLAQEPLALNVEIMRNNSDVTEWRSHILNGIKFLPREGNPGKLIVFGENAEPILTGNTEDDIFIAAAEFDQGRIIAIAQDCFGSNLTQANVTTNDTMSVLSNNLKNWLTKEKFAEGSIIINAEDRVNKKKLMLSKIVIYQGGLGNIPLIDLADFVRNGGALLHCLTPWKWLELNRGKTLLDAPYMALLTEAGLFYADGFIKTPKDGFLVKDNKANGAHMLRFLLEARKNVSLAIKKLENLTTLKKLIKSGFLPLRTIVENLMNNCTVEIKKDAIPSHQKPVNGTIERELLHLWLFYFELLEPVNIKAPGVNLFPGDFTNSPALTSRTLEYHSDLKDYHSTGCYLPAGQTLTVEVISGNTDKDWQLLIGCHTDVLPPRDWRRWPNVAKRVKLTNTTLQLSTAFGGLIYLISPNKPKLNIKVKLDNVVDSPQFRLLEGDQGKETWENSRHSPGLWADIVGELITITMPASSVRNLEFDALTSVMKTWDYVVRLSHDLRGTNPSNYRRQWIVTDEQPSIGYMHSGYPIVTHLNIADATSEFFVLNNTHLLKDGEWPGFHEIGHNMQRDEWTFDGTIQVTCEIFTLHAMQFVCNLKPWIHSWLKNSLRKANKFLKDGADFQKWKSSAGIALLMYAQLEHEFGWESYKKVFRRYEAMNDTEKPRTDQTKIDTWFIIFSEEVEYNLAPLAKFWNIPLSPETVARLQTLFPVGFLPDDEVARSVPDRVNDILFQFPGTVRKRHSPA